MARPSNTEERKAQITSALVKVMAKHGYAGASIADIAKSARLTPGLVHYHFKSKHEILLTVLSELVSSREARLEARLIAASGDPVAEVAAFIDVHLELGADADPDALACWILLSGEALRDRKVRRGFESALTRTAARLAATIARGRARGSFRCESDDAAASALLAAIQGYFVLAATARSIIPEGSAARAVKRMAEGLLGCPRGLVKREDRS
jgi:TetR/AcrR family transcriptional regulator, transcriptional repressor of bet genes